MFQALGVKVSSKEAKKYFEELDEDGNGLVTLEEFKVFMETASGKNHLKVLGKQAKQWERQQTERELQLKHQSSKSKAVLDKLKRDSVRTIFRVGNRARSSRAFVSSRVGFEVETVETEVDCRISTLKTNLKNHGEMLLRSTYTSKYHQHSKQKLQKLLVFLKRNLYWKLRKEFHRQIPFPDYSRFATTVQQKCSETIQALNEQFLWSYHGK